MITLRGEGPGEKVSTYPPGPLAINIRTGNPANTKYLYNICTSWTNVEDFGLMLYKCYKYKCFVFAGNMV